MTPIILVGVAGILWLSIEMNFNIDGSQHRVGNNGTEVITDLQHDVKAGRC